MEVLRWQEEVSGLPSQPPNAIRREGDPEDEGSDCVTLLAPVRVMLGARTEVEGIGCREF